MGISKVLLLCLAAALPTWADLTASSPRWHGIVVHFEAGLEPPSSGTGMWPGFVLVGDARVSRVIDDPNNQAYFGYDLEVEPRPGSNVFQVRILPLSLTPAQMQDHANWTRMSLPNYPVVPEVRVGDTIAIDLLVNRSSHQKIVDLITLTLGSPPSAGPARDFSLADVEMFLDRPRIHVSGTLMEATSSNPGGISGDAVWFYLAKHGRFILSLRPLPKLGFHQAGEVSGSTLTLHDGATEYRLDSASRIAPGAGRFHVYVLHDPSWKPQGASTREDFQLGAVDKVERLNWLIRQLGK